MKFFLSDFHQFLVDSISLYESFAIYGYGHLGQKVHEYCLKLSKDIIIIDENLNNQYTKINRLSELDILDEQVLIINTVMNPVEALNVYVKLKNKFTRHNIINCHQLLIQKQTNNYLLNIEKKGYLLDIGWIEACKQKKSCDKFGNPLPWVTYSFIDYIEAKLNKNMDLFEFGSGASSIWYANKVNEVFSVEHNKSWFDSLQNSLICNLHVLYQELDYDGKYCRYLANINKKFDLIVIDGRDRVNCIIQSIEYLKQEGVIVLDDSERKQYQQGIAYLSNNNFKEIAFWGIAPGIFFKKCTSIFYRENNCLGI